MDCQGHSERLGLPMLLNHSPLSGKVLVNTETNRPVCNQRFRLSRPFRKVCIVNVACPFPSIRQGLFATKDSDCQGHSERFGLPRLLRHPPPSDKVLVKTKGHRPFYKGIWPPWEPSITEGSPLALCLDQYESGRRGKHNTI